MALGTANPVLTLTHGRMHTALVHGHLCTAACTGTYTGNANAPLACS